MATTITATTNRQSQTDDQILPSSVPLRTSRPVQTCVPSDATFSNSSPKLTSWFQQRALTSTHKRIAHAFYTTLSSHSQDIHSSKHKFMSKLERLRLSRLDNPSSATHPIEDLLSASYIEDYVVGTGEALTNFQCTKMLEAENEIIIVTGFLNPTCASIKNLNRTIEILATRQVLKNIRRGTDSALKVHICFSSSGILQKVLHTKNPKGRVWKKREWKKLGLGDPSYLKGKIDLTVKSIFVRPVGLLHGKYMIVDRRILVVPSCNLSWEEWLEGATTYLRYYDDSPDCVVRKFVEYWESVWRHGEEPGPDRFEPVVETFTAVRLNEGGGSIVLDRPRGLAIERSGWEGFVPTVFLPHPESGSFPPVWPFGEIEAIWKILRSLAGLVFENGVRDEEYLGNPQNAFWMAAIEGAEKSIYVHTPNITAKPLIDALMKAVKRGVVVEIVTSMGMMKWEQLVTAGTTTDKCLTKMVVELQNWKQTLDEEEAATTGGLWIYRYDAKRRPPLLPFVKRPEDNFKLTWYDKSHVKCLIVDEEVMVLGSGNFDRASWATSQEVNVGLFLDSMRTGRVRQGLVDALAGRLEVFRGSGWVTGGLGDDEYDYGVDGVPRTKRPAYGV
ncbi:uncharacterized protein DFL_005550 [Arthrobotrys flagrans]|uniref:PLD phosphodiesterase domain-containing protein n=1 Tax=Arthrobotrys flagrans TaxID=97331 RepID=A0A436ZXS0_ARTFL|nr:hypothetical protein DFL_005550 [Arthrobotrys flagrans]